MLSALRRLSATTNNDAVPKSKYFKKSLATLFAPTQPVTLSVFLNTLYDELQEIVGKKESKSGSTQRDSKIDFFKGIQTAISKIKDGIVPKTLTSIKSLITLSESVKKELDGNAINDFDIVAKKLATLDESFFAAEAAPQKDLDAKGAPIKIASPTATAASPASSSSSAGSPSPRPAGAAAGPASPASAAASPTAAASKEQPVLDDSKLIEMWLAQSGAEKELKAIFDEKTLIGSEKDVDETWKKVAPHFDKAKTWNQKLAFALVNFKNFIRAYNQKYPSSPVVGDQKIQNLLATAIKSASNLIDPNSTLKVNLREDRFVKVMIDLCWPMLEFSRQYKHINRLDKVIHNLLQKTLGAVINSTQEADAKIAAAAAPIQAEFKLNERGRHKRTFTLLTQIASPPIKYLAAITGPATMAMFGLSKLCKTLTVEQDEKKFPALAKEIEERMRICSFIVRLIDPFTSSYQCELVHGDGSSDSYERLFEELGKELISGKNATLVSFISKEKTTYPHIYQAYNEAQKAQAQALAKQGTHALRASQYAGTTTGSASASTSSNSGTRGSVTSNSSSPAASASATPRASTNGSGTTTPTAGSAPISPNGGTLPALALLPAAAPAPAATAVGTPMLGVFTGAGSGATPRSSLIAHVRRVSVTPAAPAPASPASAAANAAANAAAAAALAAGAGFFSSADGGAAKTDAKDIKTDDEDIVEDVGLDEDGDPNLFTTTAFEPAPKPSEAEAEATTKYRCI